MGRVTYLVEDIPGRRTKRRYRRFNAHVCQLKRFRLRQMRQKVVPEETLPGTNSTADEVTPPDTQGEPLIDEDGSGTEATSASSEVDRACSLCFGK